MDQIKQIIGVYTSEALPPPHAYIIDFEANIKDNSIDVDISLQYIGREDLTIEELNEEGFSGDDDFQWKGSLPAAWISNFQKKISIAVSEPSENSDIEKVDVTVFLNNDKTITLNNKFSWIYLIQEFYQGCLEAGQFETPLLVCIYKATEENNIQYNLKLSFQYLTLEIETIKNGEKKNHQANWKVGKEIMEEIFLPDYIYEDGLENLPSKKGIWIDPGEGRWYNIDTSAFIGKKPYKSEKLFKMLDKAMAIPTT